MPDSSWRVWLVDHVWWTWSATAPTAHSLVVHWFNLLEGTVWLALPAVVARRFARHRNGQLEIFDSLAFATFGASDFIEAYQLTSWLIWLKLLNLVVLLRLRYVVRGRWYPRSRVY